MYGNKSLNNYIFVDRNKARILDSLYQIGSYGKKYLDSKGNYRYSEHSGYLYFYKNKLMKIIINANAQREDDDDTEILFPNDSTDAYNYVYTFHTHPATPFLGYRLIKDNILYEYPSVNDILLFIDLFNYGKVQGMIIITPEGLYLIRATSDDKIIVEDENKAETKLSDIFDKINKKIIKKYKKKMLSLCPVLNESGPCENFINYFYNVVAMDFSFIKSINEKIATLFNNQLIIHFKPRYFSKSLNEWIIDQFYIPIYK